MWAVMLSRSPNGCIAITHEVWLHYFSYSRLIKTPNHEFSSEQMPKSGSAITFVGFKFNSLNAVNPV